MRRETIVLPMLDPGGRGLEIGAGYAPMFPKAKGFRVETVDHLGGEDLRRKYREIGKDASCVEEVDHVWRGEPLDELVPHHGAYDFIYASNVIEHMPDVLGFINSCDRLLNDKGVAVVVVPDKRFCFDALRPIASTGDIVQAHLERRTRHPEGKVFDQVAYEAQRRGHGIWRRRTLGPIRLRGDLEAARNALERASAASEYLDTHGWQFVPSSFRLMLHDLHATGLTPMKEVAFHDPRGQGHEFFISFARWGPGCPLDRATLCRRVLYEQRAGLDDFWNSAVSFLQTALSAGRRLVGLGP